MRRFFVDLIFFFAFLNLFLTFLNLKYSFEVWELMVIYSLVNSFHCINTKLCNQLRGLGHNGFRFHNSMDKVQE